MVETLCPEWVRGDCSGNEPTEWLWSLHASGPQLEGTCNVQHLEVGLVGADDALVDFYAAVFEMEKWVEMIEGFAYLYCTVNGIATAPIPDEQVEALLDRNGVDLRQAFLLEDNPMFLNCDGLFVVGTPNPRWSDAVVAYFRMHGIPEFPKMDSDECRKWVSEAIVRLSAG